MTSRKQPEAALRESEALLRAVLESTTDGILVVDEEMRVLHWNARFAEMWSVPGDVLETRDDDELRAVAREQLQDPDEFERRVRELPEIGEVVDTLLFKDGRIYERHFVPLMREGRFAGRVLSFRDVTERKRAMDALQKAREELEGRVERQMLRNNPYGLTFREFTVLHLVAAGRSDKEIGGELSISPLTVHKHVANILAKMSAASRTEAGVRATREGLLD